MCFRFFKTKILAALGCFPLMVSKLSPSVTVQLNNCSAWSKGACRRPRVTSRWDGKSPKVPKRSAFSHHTSSVGRMFSRFKTWRTTRGAGKPGSRTPAAPIVHSAVSGHLSTSVRWSLWHGQGLNSLQQRRKKHVKMQSFWGTSTTRRFLPFE